MIFLTVGTQFPFERLIVAVDKAVGKNGFDEEIFAQIGCSTYKPRNFSSVASLQKDIFDKYFCEASCIISHAGMGTIALALGLKKPLLVMPRKKEYHEVINDHQLAIARKFESGEHLLVAYGPGEIETKLKQLKTFQPIARKSRPDLIVTRINEFMNEIKDSKVNNGTFRA